MAVKTKIIITIIILETSLSS